MGEAIGAKTIDLEWVQVHSTGLVKPDDPDAKIKFLAAEALRGIGGLVFDALGNRFANSWEDGTMLQERCGRTNLLSASLSTRRLPTKLPGIASIALGGE